MTKIKTQVKLGFYTLEAPPGFEPGIRVLQTRALPLGHGADNILYVDNKK